MRRYAWECQTQEGGWGLDSVLRESSWKLRGIVNGIDYSEWSPQVGPASKEPPKALNPKPLGVPCPLGGRLLLCHFMFVYS